MKLKITALLFLFTLVKVFGQAVPTTVNFKTPEVDAFNRFVETPVSQYTGVPNISIPLYEINIKGVNVPITLNYHAGGIRVDQDATNVGLGWSLSYGGEISRKTRGIPDEDFFLKGGTNAFFSVNDFMKLPTYATNPSSETSLERYDRMRAAKYGETDFMPDDYYYSVLGYSGRFMFSQKDNKFVLFPKEDIEIKNYLDPAVRRSSSWNLKTPEGISIDFGKGNCTTAHSATIDNVPSKIFDSWQVSAIKNNYNDSITYKYENFDYWLTKINGQSVQLNSRTSPIKSTRTSDVHLFDSKIKTINFPGGRIEFITQLREDMPGTAISEINVYNSINTLMRTIKFNYGYFYGNAYEMLTNVNPMLSVKVSDDYKSKRLKLEGISIKNGNEQPLLYAFDYYTNDLMPSKYSFSQDHWGFYNGIPNTSDYGFIPNLDKSFKGGDRRVKPDKSNVFSLKSIVYPEGGKREFIYENNNASKGRAPVELLMTYQDDNITDKYAGIYVSSYSRNTNYPAADQVIDRTRFFRNRFTVPGGSYPSIGKGWDISTNFGISDKEKTTPFFADNVEFSLERINSDNTRNLIKRFNTTPSSGSPRNGVDTAGLFVGPGTYEMTVKMVYLNGAGSDVDNQPYNLYFFVKWRELDSASMINVGGLRIKDINYYDNKDVLVKKKNYVYENPWTSQKIPHYTSGRIVSLPQYFQRKMKNLGRLSGVTWYEEMSSNSVLPLETTSGSFAGYEYVDEYDVDFNNSQNNLKTSYHFSFLEPYFGKEYLYKNIGLWESKEWTRGKLLNKYYYKNNKLIKSEDMEYYYWSPHLNNDTEEDYVEEINTDFVSWQSLAARSQSTEMSSWPEDFYDVSRGTSSNCVCFFYGPEAGHINQEANQVYDFGGILGIPTLTCNYDVSVPYFKHNTAFDKLKSKVTTTYDDDTKNPVIQTENYNYERTPTHYQLTKTTRLSSSDATLSSINKYPQDLSLNGNAETGRLKLISNHQLITVLSQSSTKNTSTITTRTDYKVDPLTDLVVPDINTLKNTVTGAEEVKNVYLKFDDKGNILSMKQADGMVVNYIWSYMGQFPVAEIKNADYSAIENILTKAGIESFRKLSPEKADLDAFLSALKTSLVAAQITSYVYTPLVGMTSSTDPKGNTIYYEYDGLQRLKLIRDDKRNILKDYSYNYSLRYRNKEISKTFTRTNCSSNAIGGSVIYRVPEGTYVELTQLEADNKALNDLNTKGQAYANGNAPCTICTGEWNKIINGVCESANKIYTKSVKNGSSYLCTFYLKWSDGSQTSPQQETRPGPCLPPQN